jgi:hypothetical protein
LISESLFNLDLYDLVPECIYPSRPLSSSSAL